MYRRRRSTLYRFRKRLRLRATVSCGKLLLDFVLGREPRGYGGDDAIAQFWNIPSLVRKKLFTPFSDILKMHPFPYRENTRLWFNAVICFEFEIRRRHMCSDLNHLTLLIMKHRLEVRNIQKRSIHERFYT